MENGNKIKAIVYALMAAVFYALNMPLSKVLLRYIEPTFMASLLYLGAGIGVGIIFLLTKKEVKEENLSRSDLPYTIGMIVLDIAAPILLMYGLMSASAENASLLYNFEIVATSIMALFIFKEQISLRLWMGIVLITVSSILLSINDLSGFNFSKGSLLVLAATCCWGMENNCTRQISGKNTFQIVMIKGIFSGLGSLIIALITGETMPQVKYMAFALLLGFVAYGLSIFLYIKSQKYIGAAKTSAYYAVAAPFVGALLSHLIHNESLNSNYGIALVIMVIGSAIVVADTLIMKHHHSHTHTITHTHDGTTHTHKFTHDHDHTHFVDEGKHGHTHSNEEIKAALGH